MSQTHSVTGTTTWCPWAERIKKTQHIEKHFNVIVMLPTVAYLFGGMREGGLIWQWNGTVLAFLHKITRINKLNLIMWSHKTSSFDTRNTTRVITVLAWHERCKTQYKLWHRWGFSHYLFSILQSQVFKMHQVQTICSDSDNTMGLAEHHTYFILSGSTALH